MLPSDFIETVNDAGEEIVVFSMVRNEDARIRAWLRHYRDMGVRLFAVVDNGSTDGTFEYLSRQPDVVVTRVLESFSAAACGVDWLNEFHRRVKPATWVLFADCDELLLYRGWPEVSLSAFVKQAAEENCNAVFGFMLDMYPRGPLQEAVLPADGNPFDVAPCFDSEYSFRIPPRKPWAPRGNSIEVVGGPRMRMLSSYKREISATWVTHFFRGQIDRFIPIVPKWFLPFLVRIMPQTIPALSKAPLVLSGHGIQYENNHNVFGATFYRENCIFGHFKFLADFAERVRTEAARGEHYRRGAEYIRYADAIKQGSNLCMAYEGTRDFEGTAQLVALGLIRDIGDLVSRIAARQEPNTGVANSATMNTQFDGAAPIPESSKEAY